MPLHWICFACSNILLCRSRMRLTKMIGTTGQNSCRRWTSRLLVMIWLWQILNEFKWLLIKKHATACFWRLANLCSQKTSDPLCFALHIMYFTRSGESNWFRNWINWCSFASSQEWLGCNGFPPIWWNWRHIHCWSRCGTCHWPGIYEEWILVHYVSGMNFDICSS